MLPVRQVINTRLSIPDISCPLCGLGEESAKHLFMECKIIEILWLSSPWSLHISAFQHLSIKEWIFLFLTNDTSLNLLKDQAHQFCVFAVVIMDMVWFSRNKMVFDGVMPEPKLLLSKVVKIAGEHLVASSKFNRQPPLLKTWIPPPSPWLKINFDIAIRPSFSGLSTVVRDYLSNFVFAWTAKDVNLDPQVADAKAACLGLSESLKQGLSSTIIEGDAATVIAPLFDWSIAPPWSIEPLTKEARSLLSSFSVWNVCYVPRLANRAAHSLAQWAAFCNCFGSIPISCLPQCVLCGELDEEDGDKTVSLSSFI